MDHLLAYGLMAVVIAAVCAVNWNNNRPVREAADRFGLLFLKAREYALAQDPPLPEIEEEGGSVRLLPLTQQSSAVRSALESGGDEAMAGFDRQMEQALRDLFGAIGRSAHLKTHYYNYYNNLFSLHRLFLQVCGEPEAPLSPDEWIDLKLYWSDRARMTGLVDQRLSAGGRRTLAAAPPLQRKEGTG